MDRVTALLRSVGKSLCDKGRRAVVGELPFGDVLLDVARCALEDARRTLPSDDLKRALAETATAGPDAFAEALARTLDQIGRAPGAPYRAEVEAYLGCLPVSIRQVLRRPSDPAGATAPENLTFFKPDDLLVFLPPRVPRFHPAGEPDGLDDWVLDELAGFGECSEVWAGSDDARPDESPACLKFATDPKTAAAVVDHQDLFQRVFELTDAPGIVPLRSVFLETDPPCLESLFVPGYDLTAVIHDWRWRYDSAKPEAALKLVRRLADVVALAHAKGLVHRDLKPSNVILYPTEGARFTIWVTDFGWGQVQARRSVELGKVGTPRAEQVRLGRRGAYTPLYAAPDIGRGCPPDPRDDVHALGVIWYQLICRDPNEGPPVGTDWAVPYYAAGLTDAQTRLLTACVSPRADKRPANAIVLAEELGKLAAEAKSAGHAPGHTDGSRLLAVKAHAVADTIPAGAVRVRNSPSGTVRIPSPRPAPEAVEYGYGGYPTRVRNSLGMTFALVPPGRFRMGSPDGEPGRRPHEGPRREVHITHPFYLSITPVTQAEYEAVTGKNPAHFTAAHGGGPNHPVESVTWFDADGYCLKLGLVSAELKAGRVYRLPTEAEWEYAGRAGTATPFVVGNSLSGKDAHFLAPGAGGRGAAARTCPVGRFPANPFGLHDVHGNVFEWVRDWHAATAYQSGAGTVSDPTGPAKGTEKVARGGSYASFAGDCRSAARRAADPAHAANTTGFRVLLQIGKS